MVVGERLTQTADEAVSAATVLGFPVVMKVESPDLPHKTEAGVIRLNLRTDAEIRAAYAAVMANAAKVSPAPRINGVLVQPMVNQGVELVIGARNDSLFGPLIVVGLGGILVEVLQDSALSPAPVTPQQALAMLQRLKGHKLLAGFRGMAAVDINKLADIVSRVSCFATRKTIAAPGKSGSQGVFDPVASGTMRTTAKSPIQTAAGTVSQLNTMNVTMPTHEPTMSSE